MNAFVINHFGDNLLYLKYEIYFLFCLRKHTSYDIVYLYSINDTPKEYIEIIKSLNLNIKTISYDDNNVTYNVKFESHYENFNLLRTCNYIYAYTLTQYDKVCIVESDQCITSNIDDIFKLHTPSVVYYKLDKSQITKNIKIKITAETQSFFLKHCHVESFTNGGVMLFKPSIKNFERLKHNISIVIENKCIYPSETLFLCSVKKFYNLPIYYNMSHFFVTKYNIKEEIKILHFNNTKYKPVYIIEDETFDISQMKNPIKKKILQNFKKDVYDKYINIVQKIPILFVSK